MHASELFGARLDNHVQTGAALFVLSGSVAFVALSREAEYEYACVIRVHRDASRRVRDLRAPKAVAKPAIVGLMGWFMNVYGPRSGQWRERIAQGGGEGDRLFIRDLAENRRA